MMMVLNNGSLYKIADYKWRRFVQAKSEGQEVTLGEFGGQIVEFRVLDISMYDTDDFKRMVKRQAS